jgi:hypothetical protein
VRTHLKKQAECNGSRLWEGQVEDLGLKLDRLKKKEKHERDSPDACDLKNKQSKKGWASPSGTAPA